jgi:hypothetical protein
MPRDQSARKRAERKVARKGEMECASWLLSLPQEAFRDEFSKFRERKERLSV